MWRPAKVLKMCNMLAVGVSRGFVGSRSGRVVIRNPDNQLRCFRCISALLIVAICGCLVLPLPMSDVVISSRLSGKDSSVPFPCMRRPCACRSAEECWRKCCCFSHKQKLAWAAENDVKVPDYVLDPADDESKSDQPVKGVLVNRTNESGDSEGRSSVESAPASPFLVSVLNLLGFSAPESLLPSGSECCVVQKAKDSDSSGEDGAVGIRFVSTVQALECGGISLSMAMISQFYVVDGGSVVSGGALPEYLLAVRSDELYQAPASPPEPPPRLCGE